MIPIAPTTLSVTFSEPLLVWSLSTDFKLDRVADDGTTTALPLAPVEGLDASGKTLVANLSQGALTTGRYRFLLSGTNTLIGADGSSLPAGPDQLLSEFTVRDKAAPGGVLADAIDLGMPGSTPSEVGGSLNLAANSGDVALYRVTLPSGQTWRLGAEVVGGDFSKVLALFDAAGRPIATAEYGRTRAPENPFLFEGLAPGTYYFGVSGGGNVPGQPGGYDPATGSMGTAARGAQGGAFQFVLVADPLTDPTTLRQFSLDRADPHDPRPTGLSLQFSGALGFARNANGGPTVDLGEGLTLVDSAGKSWPLHASSYSEDAARISLLFGEPLPAGHYTVGLAAPGGLTDLAGRPPVASDQTAGVLATFDVFPAHASASADPLNFGPLYPRAAEAGITLATDVAAGATASFRFVVSSPGLYMIRAKDDGAPVAISGQGDSGPLALGSQLRMPLDLKPEGLTLLKAGVYTLDVTATGTQAAHVSVTIQTNKSAKEALIQNGVGQGPALDLRLIAPPLTSNAAASDGPAAYQAPTNHAASPPSNAAGNTAGMGASATTGTPALFAAGLFLTPGGVAVGQPAAGSAHVEAAGPGGAGNAPSLAFIGDSLPQGINYGLSPSGRPSPDRFPTKAANPRGDIGGAFDTDGAIVAANLPEATPAFAVYASQRSDTDFRADPEAGWVDRLRSTVASWVASPIPDDLAADVVQALAQAEAQAEAGKAGPDAEETQVELAGFGSHIGIGMAAILTAHFGRNLRGRSTKGRLPARLASRSSGAKPKGNGPSRPHRRK